MAQPDGSKQLDASNGPIAHPRSVAVGARLRQRPVDSVATRWYCYAGDPSYSSTRSVLRLASRGGLISTGNTADSEYVHAEITFARKLKKPVCEVSVQGARHSDLTDIQPADFQIGGTEDWDVIVTELAPTLRRAIGPREVFIAHDDQDREFLQRVVQELSRELEVWYEPERIRIVDNRNRMVKEAIDRAGIVLAVISENSAVSNRFCQHVVTAISQDDQIIPLVHRAAPTSRQELLDSWAGTIETVLEREDDKLGRIVRDRFPDIQDLEPAEFVDGEQDGQVIGSLVEVLKSRQAELGPDEKQEQEVKDVYSSFLGVLDAKGYDVKSILSLPDDAHEAPASEATLAAGSGDANAPQDRTATPNLTSTSSAPPLEGIADPGQNTAPTGSGLPEVASSAVPRDPLPGEAGDPPAVPDEMLVGQAVGVASREASEAQPKKSSMWKGILIGAGVVVVLLVLLAVLAGGEGDLVATQQGDIRFGESLTGEIGRDSQRDQWTLKFEGAPGVVTVDVAAVAGSPLDPALKVIDPNSEVIRENDDFGAGFNAQATVTLPSDGEYVIEVTASGFGSVGEYVIAVSGS